MLSATQGRFEVIERFNGYEVRDTVTGQTHWLSDGVDAVTARDGDGFLSPGTPDFTKFWAADLNSNEDETLEAYFREQWEREHAQETPSGDDAN